MCFGAIRKMEQACIIYLSPYDILRPRTNQLSDVRFTEGFAQNNCNTHLVVPFVFRKDNILKSEVESTYGLSSKIQIHYLPTNFTSDVNGKLQLAQVTMLAVRQTLDLLKNRSGKGTIYIISRSTHLLRPLFTLRKIFRSLFSNVHLIHWAHDFHSGAIYQSIYKKSDYILATNSSILESIHASAKREKSNGTFTLNPITEAQATESYSKEQAREQVHLSNIQNPLVVYTGKLGQHYDKEMKFILDAAQLLPQVTFLFTGGKPDVVQYWENFCKDKKLQNVIFTGYLPDYRKIKYYQYAADILISYYTHQGHDVRYNLPNKICEYMLTGNPIVTPDYPATRDLLNDANCIFTAPENAEALAKSIQEIVNDPQAAKIKALQALKDVKEITFKKVSARLLKQFPT